MYPQKGPLTQRTLPLPLALVPAALSQTRGVGKAEEGPPSWFMPLEITLHPVSPIIAPPIHLSFLETTGNHTSPRVSYHRSSHPPLQDSPSDYKKVEEKKRTAST